MSVAHKKNECCFQLPVLPDYKTFILNDITYYIAFKEEAMVGCCKKVYTSSTKYSIYVTAEGGSAANVGYLVVCDGKLICKCSYGEEKEFIETCKPICVTVFTEQEDANDKNNTIKTAFRKSVCCEKELYEFIIIKTQDI